MTESAAVVTMTSRKKKVSGIPVAVFEGDRRLRRAKALALCGELLHKELIKCLQVVDGSRRRIVESSATMPEVTTVDDLPNMFAAGYVEVSRCSANYKTLRDVKAALRRLKDGTFGYCVSCDEKIDLERLKAVPWTQHCRSCALAASRDS